MDVAQLGLEVQSGSVKAATNDLNKLTNAAKVAENASKGLSFASGRFDTKQIEQMASQMGAVERTSNAAARAMAAASIASQRAAANGNAQARAIAQTAGQAQQQVRNLAFQFQDIATMMAMGQSPFMLLAQQLPQVTMYGGRLTGVMTALRSTLASFISPLGLITTGFVLLGTAAISYFSELWSRGSQSEEVLQKQEALVARVAERWGEAYPAIKKYNDELIRAREQAELLSAIDIVKDDMMKNVPGLIERMRIETADLISMLSQSGAEPEVITAYQKALEAAYVKMQDTKDASGELNSAIGILTNDIGSSANPAISSMIDMLRQLAEASRRTAEEVASVVNSASAVQSKLQDTIQAATFRDNGAVRSTNSFMPYGNAPTPSRRPLIELEGTSWIKDKKHRDNPYETATRSVKEQTAALHAQTAAQAALNPLVNDYGFSAARAKAAQELLSAAQRAGAAAGKELKDVQQLLGGDFEKLSPAARKQAEAMLQLASNYAVATEAAEIFKEKQKEARKRAEDALNTGKNVISGMIDGFIEGEKAADIFANSLKRIGKALVDDVLNSIFKIQNLSGGGGGGGWLSTLFGGLFGGGSQFSIASASGIGLYADGTASARAGLAMVGEEGPELVRFRGGEKVIPNHQLRGGNDNDRGQGISVSAPVEINIDATGADAAGLARVERQLASLKAELPNQIVSTVQNAQKRRGL